MKTKIALALLLAVFYCNIYAAVGKTQAGRYITIKNKPRKEQVELMSQVIQIRFPQNVKTIGHAMEYLLVLSGYDLVPEKSQSYAMRLMLGKPLPVVDRELGPVTMKAGLETLAGPVFDIVEDPVNRLIAFNLKSSYQKYLQRGHA